jgi:tyrosyl-tRNA synthetase
MDTKEQKIERLLSRGVEDVIEKDHLRAALLSGKKLRVKLGIDPTSPDLHLGHAVILRKLREFQDLGHKAVLIIGDFTAQIGDPSGRDKTRPPLTEKEVKENMKKYLAEAGKIIDIKKAEVKRNSSWLGKFRGDGILKLFGMISLQQLIEREDFQKRLAEHASIRMHELMYPLMQGYDSVAIKADVELGGTDQLFNILMGRTLMEKFDMKPQDVMTMPLLVGLDGVKKMSKSVGNYIGLSDKPEDMFGKVMSVPDSLMENYFKLCTDLSEAEINELSHELQPKELKMKLGAEIVRHYYGDKAAVGASEAFDKLFSKREFPTDAPELKLKGKKISAVDLVVASGVAKSKSEVRRLIEQGGFEIDGEKYTDPMQELVLRGGEAIRIGKKHFFRVGK